MSSPERKQSTSPLHTSKIRGIAALQRNRAFLKYTKSPLANTVETESVAQLTVQLLMNKRKINRISQDAIEIYEELRNFPIFSLDGNQEPITVKEIQTICRNAELRKAPKDQVIYREGERCTGELFLVLSGEVALESNAHDVFLNENLRKGRDQINIFKKIRPSYANTPEKGSPMIKELKRHDSIKQEDMIFHMQEEQLTRKKSLSRKGSESHILEESFDNHREFKRERSHFGESALFNHQFRRETATATKDSEFLILNKESIVKMQSLHETEREQKAKFIINSVPLIEKVFSSNVFQGLLKCFEFKHFKKGVELCTEGERGDYFYLIHKGEFQVTKRTSTEILSQHRFGNKKLEDHYGVEKHHKHQIEVCILADKSFFGEEIVFSKEGIYQYTVKPITQTGTVYVIEKQKFIFRFPKYIFEAMRTNFDQKQEKNTKFFEDKQRFTSDVHNKLFLKKKRVDQEEEILLQSYRTSPERVREPKILMEGSIPIRELSGPIHMLPKLNLSIIENNHTPIQFNTQTNTNTNTNANNTKGDITLNLTKEKIMPSTGRNTERAVTAVSSSRRFQTDFSDKSSIENFRLKINRPDNIRQRGFKVIQQRRVRPMVQPLETLKCSFEEKQDMMFMQFLKDSPLTKLYADPSPARSSWIQKSVPLMNRTLTGKAHASHDMKRDMDLIVKIRMKEPQSLKGSGQRVYMGNLSHRTLHVRTDSSVGIKTETSTGTKTESSIRGVKKSTSSTNLKIRNLDFSQNYTIFQPQMQIQHHQHNQPLFN